MKLPGLVDERHGVCGAFDPDIGVHQDGLVHVSQLSDRFVKDPAEIVKVQQKVMVTVTEVDLPRKRIALSMKAAPEIGASATGSADFTRRTASGGWWIQSLASTGETAAGGLVHGGIEQE